MLRLGPDPIRSCMRNVQQPAPCTLLQRQPPRGPPNSYYYFSCHGRERVAGTLVHSSDSSCLTWCELSDSTRRKRLPLFLCPTLPLLFPHKDPGRPDPLCPQEGTIMRQDRDSPGHRAALDRICVHTQFWGIYPLMWLGGCGQFLSQKHKDQQLFMLFEPHPVCSELTPCSAPHSGTQGAI